MEVRFTFEGVDAPSPTLGDKEMRELITLKWGMDSLRVDTWSFSPALPVVFDSVSFLTQFVKAVRPSSLGDVVSVEFDTLTLYSIGNAFFKKLSATQPPLIRADVPHKPIAKCMDRKVGDVWVSDLLQAAILDEDGEEWGAFSEEDRKELIFQVMRLFVVGGKYCQFEDTWEPYERVVVAFYKELIGQGVVRNQSGAIQIVTKAYRLRKVNDADVADDWDRSLCLAVVDPVAKRVRLVRQYASL